MGIYTLCKAERLNSKILIGKMFEGGSKSFSIFPIRVVYMPVEQGEAPASILISVSKRRFKSGETQPCETSDTRSLPEEQISSGGRTATPGKAFGYCLYLSVGRACATAELEEKMKIALSRISEKLSL